MAGLFPRAIFTLWELRVKVSGEIGCHEEVVKTLSGLMTLSGINIFYAT